MPHLPFSGTVLVAEDDQFHRDLFKVIFERTGFTVELAENGEQALRVLESRSFDVIVLDLLMPVTSGFAVLAQFSASRPELLGRTVVVSGAAEPTLASLESQRVYRLLRKPFDLTTLLATVLRCSRHSARARTGKGEPRDLVPRGTPLSAAVE